MSQARVLKVSAGLAVGLPKCSVSRQREPVYCLHCLEMVVARLRDAALDESVGVSRRLLVQQRSLENVLRNVQGVRMVSAAPPPFPHPARAAGYTPEDLETVLEVVEAIGVDQFARHGETAAQIVARLYGRPS